MPEIKNNFLKGKMNKDADERIVGTGEYKDALNIQVGVAENGDAGSVHNVLGNIQIDSLNISGAYSLGTVADTQTDKIYWFIYGTSVDAIAEYDEATNTVSPVLVDATKKILNFPATQITAANVIEGYLIYTDNNSEPKNIDIELFKSGSTNFSTTTQIYDDLLSANRYIRESDITLIKKKPASAPTVTTNTFGKKLKDSDGNDVKVSADLTGAVIGTTEIVFNFSAETNLKINDSFVIQSANFLKKYKCKVVNRTNLSSDLVCVVIESIGLFAGTLSEFNGTVSIGEVLFKDKFVRFAYRWKFKNNQYSVMSPFTETIFYPKPVQMSSTAYDINKGYNDVMENDIRSIVLSNIDCSDTNIDSVEILYKESNNTNIYVYKTVRKQELDGYGEQGITSGYASISIEAQSFYNLLPDNQLFRQYDDVPYRAKASEIVANRVLFANYENGLNVIKNSKTNNPETYSPSFNISTERRFLGFRKSIKTNRSYQFGVLFEDGYGRQTPVFSNETGVFQTNLNELSPPESSRLDDNLFKSRLLGGYQFKVSMDKLPEEFQFDDRIKTFKYYIKEQSKEYYNFVVDSAHDDTEDSTSLWLVVPSYEINKINEGDLIVFKRKKDTYLFDFQILPDLNDIVINLDGILSVDVGGNILPEEGPWGPNTGNDLGNESDYNDATDSVGVLQAVNDKSAKFKILSLVGSKPSTLDSTNSFDGNFFIKIEKNNLFTNDNYSNSAFETVPEENVLDLYYETEDSYPISLYGKDQTLRWFNCFDLGNGIESNRIKDEFNETYIENQVRVSTVIKDEYKQKHNKYGFIFSSGLFNSRNGVNDINQFNVAEAITKDLNPEYGSIQKIHTRNTDVVTFCEDKVLRVLANKDALFNADGNANLTSVNAVLGQAIPYAGEYGISTNPESFASHGYQIYFTDRARNAVLRLSRDGLTVISNYGMSDFFRDKFNLLTASESISFREGVDGWTSRLSFVPETGVSLNGNYYTLKNGELWRHHAPGVGYNNFYGTQYNSTLNFIYNQDPSFRKGFKTLNYEGTSGWTAASIETDQQSGKVDYFINKEGKWFNNIKGIANVTNDLDTKEFSIQGLGNITGFTIS